jgi:hypothetical protein
MSETFKGRTEDEILADLKDGKSLLAISTQMECARSSLHVWLHANPERSARARLSREAAAEAWLEMAEAGIAASWDQLTLAKAKEMAHHYRWKAAKIAPDYKDKVETTHTGTVAVAAVPMHNLSQEQLRTLASIALPELDAAD